jgi:xanthine dehydrogenase small subunit
MTAAQSAPPTLTIDGDRVRLDGIPLTVTLLQYLRLSGRTGTKEGCGDGDCGACTVAIVGQGADGKPQFQAMNSCLIPLGSVVGREVVTVEGIANGNLHPVQAAMVETGGSQCGYCTPGFIMSLFAAYYDGKVDDLCVEGNLCRCTGYLPIRRAARQVTGATPNDAFSHRLAEADPTLVPFESMAGDRAFYRPGSLSEVLELLQARSDATLLAGGTDLGLEISNHRRDFPVAISLEAVPELKGVENTLDYLDIGAAVSLTQIETALHGIFPALDEMIHWFAARQVRNRATLGGNIGTASPIGDLPPVLLALDAQLKLASANGDRWLPLADFFKSYRQTDLQAGELIVSVRIPKTLPAGASQRFSYSYKIGKRGTDDISIVAAAYAIDLDDRRQIVQARLGYGGVAATPIRAIAVEEWLVGKPWSLETVQQAKPMLYDAFTPLNDLRGSAEYRKKLVANLFEKFFVEFS